MFSTTTTTTPCVASFMTGCYSEKNGVNTHDDVTLNSELDTLATVLGDAGYNTYAMATGPLVEETQLDRGFDTYWYRERNNHLYGDWRETAREKIASLAEPYFLYLHLWELHEPVQVPDAFDTPAYGRRPYDRALSALDRELEALFETLPDDTVVFFHGDHGESITGRNSTVGEWARELVKNPYFRGYDTRALGRVVDRVARALLWPDIPDHYIERGHGDNVFDFTTNVPFGIWGSDDEPQTVSEQVRQIDVFPTILDAMGVAYDPRVELDGASLLPPETVSDRDAYLRACGLALNGEENWMRGVRTGDRKYVEYPNKDWSPEVYDLTADPLELHPLDDDGLAADLRDRLPDEELMDVSHIDIEDTLRELGYI